MSRQLLKKLIDLPIDGFAVVPDEHVRDCERPSGSDQAGQAVFEMPHLGQDGAGGRADVVDPKHVLLANPIIVPGGKVLLNTRAFAPSPEGHQGNTGRNAFLGPGLYNLDISLSRSFPLRWLGESGRLTFRADAFNVLNHSNLNSPQPLIGQDDFGVALYGRQGRQSGFPAVSPLNETASHMRSMGVCS